MKRLYLYLFLVFLIFGSGFSFMLYPLFTKLAEPYSIRETREMTRGFFHLLEQEFVGIPPGQWQDQLESIRPQFGIPLSLSPCESLDLTPKEQDQLNGGQIVVQQNGDLFHFRLLDSGRAISVGPAQKTERPPALTVAFTVYILLTFGLPVLIWFLPFSRNLRKIAKATKGFGRGELDARVRISRFSSLHPLACTFNTMAERIETLVASHKELTNAVSHELRTPLARLKFGLEMLDKKDRPSDRDHYIDGLHHDINEIDELVEELLTYARFERGTPLPQNLPAIRLASWLTGIVNEEQPADSSISLSLDIQALDAQCHIKMEPRYLGRAICNVLRNALRHAHTRVRAEAAVQGPDCIIHIDDDGPGIPQDQRMRIFEPFTRLDSSRQLGTGGHGLGLAIVQRIMTWHHGSVHVTGSPLGGARFTLRWPVEPTR